MTNGKIAENSGKGRGPTGPAGPVGGASSRESFARARTGLREAWEDLRILGALFDGAEESDEEAALVYRPAIEVAWVRAKLATEAYLTEAQTLGLRPERAKAFRPRIMPAVATAPAPAEPGLGERIAKGLADLRRERGEGEP